MTGWRKALLGLAVLSCWVAGCGGGTAYIMRRPSWPYQDYRRVAVVPATPADQRAAGDTSLLVDRLTSCLSQNPAFDVLSRSEMAQIWEEQDLGKLGDAVDQGTALPEGRVKLAQALIVPKISHYHLDKRREQNQIPQYAIDRHGRLHQTGTVTVWVHTHAAQVAASVTIVDAATGEILFGHTTKTLEERKKGQNRPPKESPRELASELVESLVEDLYRTVAPVKVKADFKKDMLILATAYFDGRYDEIGKVARSLSDFLLVVRKLPAACHDNEFRVAIAAEGGRENIFEEAFMWERGNEKRGVSYSVPLDVLTSVGAERFIAKLYSVGNPEPILERAFKLERG